MVKVFDLDGTLLDSNGIWRAVDLKFGELMHLEITKEYLDFVSHATFPVSAAYTKQYFHLSLSEKEIMDIWYAMVDEAYAHQLPLKPGAQEYLQFCASQGDSMVMYTSSVPSLCHAALRRHDIEHYFSHIYFAQDIGLEKKYPESFSALSELLGAAPSDCTLFDDSPLACTAAHQARWNVVGVYDDLFHAEQSTLKQNCDRVVLRLDECIK